ncbi:hypothetical protein GQ472_01545 [archaeon]|nr:hypothetical protein [archaeon]
MNYFNDDEAKNLPRRELLLQAVLGIQSCKTKEDGIKILDDIWSIAQDKKRRQIMGHCKD